MIIAGIAMKEANLSIKPRCKNISEFRGETCHKARGKVIRPIVICVCFALSTQLLIREFFGISRCNFTHKYFYAIMHDFKNL